VISFYIVDKFKGIKSRYTPIIFKILKKWYIPTFLLVVFGLVLALNIKSYAKVKTIEPNYRIVYLNPNPGPTLTPSSAPTSYAAEANAASVTPTPTPTLKPIAASAIPTSTSIVTPIQSSAPTPTPRSNPSAPSTSSPQVVLGQDTASVIPTPGVDIPEYLLGEVNKYRASQGLSAVSSDSNTCDFAKKRAEELISNFNHDGFKNLPYSSYSRVTENIGMNGDYKEVVNQWINSSGHAENMRQDTPFVCIQSSGNYYAYEGWRP